VAHVDVRRRERMTGNVIAAEVVVSSVTVSRILKQLGLNSSKTLGPGEPIRRCDREHSGELTHIDVTKLGKFNRVGHRITGDPTGQSMTPASTGSSSMSVSTIRVRLQDLKGACCRAALLNASLHLASSSCWYR